MTPQSNVSLAAWCTLHVGGRARWFTETANEKAIRDALVWADDRQAAVHVLGGGSNVVIADEGFDGLVIKVDVRGISSVESNGGMTFEVGAGEPWDPFVAVTVAADCAGLECLSGIPGQVGGTPIQNVGAYGQDVSATITRVHVIDRERQSADVIPAEDCGFAYRTSRFKRSDRFIVTRVEYRLVRHAPPTVTYADVVSYFESERVKPSLSSVREAILQIRRRKGMIIDTSAPAIRSVGSFFVNPVVTREHFGTIATEIGNAARIPHYLMDNEMVKVPAAWLIERAGFHKGLSRGPVGVSPFQAQAIINLGGARASDVVSLAADIKRAVWDQFGIALVPEPVFVGFQPTRELEWLLEPRPHRSEEGLNP